MEHLCLSLVHLFVAFVCFVLFYKLRSDYSSPNLSPGGIGFPIVGESLSCLSTRPMGHLKKFVLDRMTRYSAQVFKTLLLCEPTAVYCGPAGNKFLLSNENKLVVTWFPSTVNRIFPSTLQSSATEEGTKVRNTLLQVLKPEALKQYIGSMDVLTRTHFATGWEDKDRVEVLPLVDQYTFWLTNKLFIGVNDPEHIYKLASAFHIAFTGIFSVPIDLPGTQLNQAIKAGKVIKTELKAIIKQRKIDIVNRTTSASQDILSQLLQLTDEV